MRSKTLLQPLARVAAMLLIFAGLAHGAESNRDSMPLVKATFAGGCFWCMEQLYDELEGVTRRFPVIRAALKRIRPTSRSAPVPPATRKR